MDDDKKFIPFSPSNDAPDANMPTPAADMLVNDNEIEKTATHLVEEMSFNYAKDINSSLPMFLRITAMLIPFALYVLNQVVNGYIYSRYTVESGYGASSGNVTIISWIIGLCIYGIAIYVGLKQHLYITKKMRSTASRSIIVANIVVTGMAAFALAAGYVISMGQFGQSAVNPIAIITLLLVSALTMFGSLTVVLPQFIYIQTNGRSKKWITAGKVLRAIWFALMALVSIFIAYIVVVVSDPSTE